MSKTDIAVSVRGLSKSYTIAHQGERHVTLAESLLAKARRPFARVPKETFWALKDVSFDIQKGDVVGIIGRNGAGKSTLLKILSRITEPTSGVIDLYGRVGSLLEVGTGFHPELTGRENVFLNGAILGMTKAEIRKQFDAIVDFAGVEQFLDTPVKRYSSGMYVRLAFAVAAHLESEILIVDEVLAVGDAEFQRKSLGKMNEVAVGGKTVLFVSHNMHAIRRLCRHALLLHGGRIQAIGMAPDVIATHTDVAVSNLYTCAPKGTFPQVTGAFVLTELPRIDLPLDLRIEWYQPAAVPDLKVGIGFNTPDGQRIFDSAPEDFKQRSPNSKGMNAAAFRVPPGVLHARTYAISVGIWSGSTRFDHVLPALTVAIEAAPIGRYLHQPTSDALVTVDCEWTLPSLIDATAN